MASVAEPGAEGSDELRADGRCSGIGRDGLDDVEAFGAKRDHGLAGGGERHAVNIVSCDGANLVSGGRVEIEAGVGADDEIAAVGGELPPGTECAAADGVVEIHAGR